VDANFMHFNER